jgi:hypothetical protein
MATTLKPPRPLVWDEASPSVFLAGSIDMGAAEPWQEAVEAGWSDLALTILNPRREAWDASWPQRMDFAPFREQVEWELEALSRATWIAMYFAPRSQAPITLLELGLHAASGRLLVCCPEGYWRKGNVDVVCARFGVPQVPTLEAMQAEIRARVLARGITPG